MLLGVEVASVGVASVGVVPATMGDSSKGVADIVDMDEVCNVFAGCSKVQGVSFTVLASISISMRFCLHFIGLLAAVSDNFLDHSFLRARTSRALSRAFSIQPGVITEERKSPALLKNK